MPREQINFPETVKVFNEEKISKTADGQVQIFGTADVSYSTEPAVHVSWVPGDRIDATGLVQISLEADASYLRVCTEFADEQDSKRSYIYSPALARAEVNKLIRVLRRARDQAYGRDE
jgi:hypothetical protein